MTLKYARCSCAANRPKQVLSVNSTIRFLLDILIGCPLSASALSHYVTAYEVSKLRELPVVSVFGSQSSGKSMNVLLLLEAYDSRHFVESSVWDPV
jgi:hypothetical protein